MNADRLVLWVRDWLNSCVSDRSICVHLWQKILFPRVCLRVCGESYDFADMGCFMESLY